jgi:FAD/FMN-containing dehydrogenase
MTDTVARVGVLEATALNELREGFRGDVIEPSSAEYDTARAVFNGMFDRRPAAILRPAGTADVIRAIGLARLSGLPLAIRGGGHSVAGFSMADGGIVIDMRGMKGIRVDPKRRTARAQAGLNWGEFDRETQAFGLATTGGRVTTTGVPGFTLGSGSGWLERLHGYAADNLISVDLVTAEGEVVTATEDENAELLWGLRGGGGNFGVVTEMEFKLHDVGPMVYGGLAAFDPEQSHEVIRMWRDISGDAPEALGWAVASVTAPPEPFVPQEW